MVDFDKLRASRAALPAVPENIVMITGHRPPKLWSDRRTLGDGYQWDNPVRQEIRRRIREETQKLLACLGANTRTRTMLVNGLLSRVKWANGFSWRESPVLMVTGGALGVDQDAAGEWCRMGLPFIVAISFEGQDRLWPEESRAIYSKMIQRAAGTIVVSPPPRSGQEVAALMHVRNEWMVSVADHLISVWDGTSGGTANCTRSWVRCGGPAPIRIDPRAVREHLRRLDV